MGNHQQVKPTLLRLILSPIIDVKRLFDCHRSDCQLEFGSQLLITVDLNLVLFEEQLQVYEECCFVELRLY
jgi:hypothetical protein